MTFRQGDGFFAFGAYLLNDSCQGDGIFDAYETQRSKFTFQYG